MDLRKYYGVNLQGRSICEQRGSLCKARNLDTLFDFDLARTNEICDTDVEPWHNIESKFGSSR
jgi:hypothetical protein